MRETVFLDEDSDISLLVSRVKERVGIDFSHYRETTLRRRISRRMAVRNCADLAAYIRLLDSDADEYLCLCADLTIKYSEFFRDSEVFQSIEEDVLPELVSGIRTYPAKLNIWSAGCATGEEAYSLAVLVRRLLQSTNNSLAVKVTGTDIDPKALETARLGTYRKDLLPGPIPEWAMPYFLDDGKSITVTHDIRQMVEFYTQDLLSGSAAVSVPNIGPGKCDLVLCRNVLIYLKRPAQLQVLAACCKMLRPGGFLVIGNREMVPKDLTDLLEIYKLDARIYKKQKQQ